MRWVHNIWHISFFIFAFSQIYYSYSNMHYKRFVQLTVVNANAATRSAGSNFIFNWFASVLKQILFTFQTIPSVFILILLLCFAFPFKNYYFCFCCYFVWKICSSAKDLMSCFHRMSNDKDAFETLNQLIHQIMIISIRNCMIIAISGPLNIGFLLTSAVQNLILNQSLFVFNCFQGLMHSR